MARTVKVLCDFCEHKVAAGTSFCPSCTRPTPWASHDERVDWEVNQWRETRAQAAPLRAVHAPPPPARRGRRAEPDRVVSIERTERAPLRAAEPAARAETAPRRGRMDELADLERRIESVKGAHADSARTQSRAKKAAPPPQVQRRRTELPPRISERREPETTERPAREQRPEAPVRPQRPARATPPAPRKISLRKDAPKPAAPDAKPEKPQRPVPDRVIRLSEPDKPAPPADKTVKRAPTNAALLQESVELLREMNARMAALEGKLATIEHSLNGKVSLRQRLRSALTRRR